MENTLGQPLSE